MTTNDWFAAFGLFVGAVWMVGGFFISWRATRNK